jgi:hypothetical protein
MGTTRTAAAAIWLPDLHTISVAPAGRWWDAIIVPQSPGLAALRHLDEATRRRPGPVVWDPNLRTPRLYFLTPPGTARTWTWPGTRALGAGGFVGIPHAARIEAPGPHWIAPPHPEDDVLVDADALRDALALCTARRGPGVRREHHGTQEAV